jgi:hypothetical protein
VASFRSQSPLNARVHSVGRQEQRIPTTCIEILDIDLTVSSATDAGGGFARRAPGSANSHAAAVTRSRVATRAVVVRLKTVTQATDLVGSSRKMTRGNATSSVPMLTRLRCPPEMPRFSTLPTIDVCVHMDTRAVSGSTEVCAVSGVSAWCAYWPSP